MPFFYLLNKVSYSVTAMVKCASLGCMACAELMLNSRGFYLPHN